MRLDKFLQVSGIVKRRVLAAEACKRGCVQVNGRVAKATREIISGDLVELRIPTREVRALVLQDLTLPTIPRARRSEFIEIQKDERFTPKDDGFWDDP